MLNKNTYGKGRIAKTAASILAAVALTFAISLVFILAVGVNPFDAYAKMFSGIFKRSGIFEVIAKATPLIIMSLGVSIGIRGGQSNLGGDGQFYVGAFCSVLVGLYLPENLPPILIWILAIAAGCLAGGAWGAIAGALKANFNTSEVIITIMLNYCGLYIVSALFSGPFMAPGGIPQTKAIPTVYALPKLAQGARSHWGIILIPILTILVYFIFRRTVLGYRIEAVGAAPEAARYAGIRSRRYLILIMFISGAFCGLAGMIEVYGSYFRVLEGITSNFGFTAMLIALLAQLDPVGIILASLFIGALKVGANSMQMGMNIPTSIVDVTQALIIVFVLILPVIASQIRGRIRKNKKEVEEA